MSVDAAASPLVLPDYGGACLTGIVPPLLGAGPRPDWFPEAGREAAQVVLLVLDGLGWHQLQARSHLAPTLASMAGGPITSVAPTTTSVALTSIVTGSPPAAHGLVGYRVRVGEGDVLNVLRWTTSAGDARELVPPIGFVRRPPFEGRAAPLVTRSEFAATGFTIAAFSGASFRGWRVPSSIVVEVDLALRFGEPFVYAYYDGVDKVAHEYGFDAHYDAELAAADRLVADVLSVLPPGAALLVTSDHGQVEVGDRCVPIAPAVMDEVALLSGEGRFRWMHARPGRVGALADAARAAHGDSAEVRTLDEIVEAGWFGGPLEPEVAARLGDVALVARDDVAFVDPADTGAVQLVCRHGSLTPAEMHVPFVGRAG